MDAKEKVRMTFDYVFGRGVGSSLPLRELEFFFSQRTGRLKTISHKGELLATFRSDGSIALTIFGAKLLTKNPRFKSSCVTIDNSVKEFVLEGRSVFAKHVKSCGNSVRPSADVAVLDGDGEVIAVGKSLLSAKMMKAFKVGVAVKVRNSYTGNKN